MRSFVGVPAYDPVTGYVYVGMPATQGIYQPGMAALQRGVELHVEYDPGLGANFGPDGSADGG